MRTTHPPDAEAMPPLRLLVEMPRSYWIKAAGFWAGGLVLIGVPTRLIPTSFFARMTPSGPLDHVFLAGATALAGLALALPVTARAGGALAGGVGTFLAVGCPICNKFVVATLGVTGAMTYFAPIQPILGAVSVLLLALTLRWRLRALASARCASTAPGGSSEEA
jgi:hypothetical protein